MQTTVAIIGAGNFGTAIADLVASNGNPTRLWMRDEELLKSIQDHNENARYLPNHKLHSNIYPTTDLEFAAKSNVLFVTVPSASFRSVSRDLSKFIRADACVISATKGVEADEDISDFKLMSQILEWSQFCGRDGGGTLYGHSDSQPRRDCSSTSTRFVT